MAKEVFNFDFCGRKLTVETGEIAKQAGGSVIVRYEDTVVLSTATASHVAKDTDFFPLTVTFEEKLYSVGKIPGGFLRREGRPSEHATLTVQSVLCLRKVSVMKYRLSILYCLLIQTAHQKWLLCLGQAAHCAYLISHSMVQSLVLSLVVLMVNM